MEYQYDYENRLVRIFYSDDGWTEFVYDGLGRRLKTIERDAGETISEETRYVYDGLDLIAELRGDNIVIASYTHGPGIDDPLIMHYAGYDYFYHKNHLGSITALTDISGSVVKEYEYDAFGNILSETSHPGDPDHNAFTYTAREYHARSGLYYYRARFYDPAIGRFITQDPIGILGGVNLYAYVGNDPVNWFDPYGLDSLYFDGNWIFWIDDDGGIRTIYEARSGPFGKGRLPEGHYWGYNLRKRTRKGMVCPDGGWSLDLEPCFETDRTLLRIHPDQDPRGTEGCIGVDCLVSQDFYDALTEYLKDNYGMDIDVYYGD